VIDGPINRDLFDRYTETQLAPTLQAGNVIILNNLSSHKSPKAAQVLKDIGCWFLPLPPYSPDLNPFEIIRAFTRTNGVHALIFAKLKALLRKAAARTYDDLWKAVGTVCDLFTEDECLNYFIAAGYKPE
jgi:transposase